MKNPGLYLQAMILIATIIAGSAVAVEIWLDLGRRGNRERERFTDERSGNRHGNTRSRRLRGRTWIMLACMIIGIVTFFAVAENAVRAVDQGDARGLRGARTGIGGIIDRNATDIIGHGA